MDKFSKIYIAGHKGLVGSAIMEQLRGRGYKNIISRAHGELDLLNQSDVAGFFKKEQPEYVFFAAAKVGGIIANNTYRAQFIYENLQIQNNIIHQSFLNKVKKLLFLGSSCIYPGACPQPMREDYLLTSGLEYTNEPYAIAKIAGMKMCEAYNIQYGTNFISVMPTNLYGANDNYDLEKSHVLPALIRKMHLGRCLELNDWDGIRKNLDKNTIEKINGSSRKDEIEAILMKYGVYKKDNTVTITLWGTGKPRREFLHSDDLADACVFLMEKIDFFSIVKKDSKEIINTHINIGTGKDISIKELAYLVKEITGFGGHIQWDTTKPDGTYQKLLDVKKINLLGWKEKIGLENGIKLVYSGYIN